MGIINVMLNFISAILWGALAGLLTAGVFMYLIHGVMNVPKIVTAIWGIIMFFFLSFQFTVWIGASKAKTYIENVVILTDQIHLSTPEKGADSVLNLEAVVQEYPVLKPFMKNTKIDYSTISGQATNVKAVFIMVSNKIINDYMWRRFWWILLGSIVSIIGISFFRRPKCKTSSYNYTNSGNQTLKF